MGLRDASHVLIDYLVDSEAISIVYMFAMTAKLPIKETVHLTNETLSNQTALTIYKYTVSFLIFFINYIFKAVSVPLFSYSITINYKNRSRNQILSGSK